MVRNAGWPGQIEQGTFDLAQVRALSSVVRAEIYYTFNPDEPLSTADVARAVGRGAATVRYHVNELLKVDLLMPVETRKRHARTEDAYVHRFAIGLTSLPPWTPEYLAAINRGFEALVRKMIRERAATMAVANLQPDYYPLNLFRIATLRLNEHQIGELRKKLADLVFEYLPKQDPNGLKMEVAGYLAPSKQDSERKFFELTGSKLVYRAEPEPPED